MKVLRIVLLLVLAVIVLVAVGGFVVFWDTTRGPLPQHAGTLTVPGLTGDVEVLRDAAGVPHIYASTTYDLFFAQGYTQAQDRWWQMEFNRHIGRGAIQELTGRTDAVMGNDIFIRTAGWRRASERDLAAMDDETRAIVQAFADGVNAYITSRPADRLALEYRLLGVTGVNITVEPWTPLDTVVWSKVMAWNLTGSYGRELTRETLLDALGADMLADYTPDWPYDTAFTIVQPEDLPLTADSLARQAGPDALARISTAPDVSPIMAGGILAGQSVTFAPPLDTGIGSNNWVATGAITETERPLLANDPHLGIQMPSIWYMIGLHCLPVSEACPFDVVGFSFPSSPGVIIGHNGQIAWGVTNVGADVQDTFLLTVNPDNPLQYRWNGEWRDMTVHEEIIDFGDGGDPLVLQVRETHLGPVLNDNDYDPETGTVSGFTAEPLVLRWPGNSLPGEESTLLSSILGINRAQNWEEFRAALSLWDLPSQNFVYADTAGNIGYQMPGRIPIRAEGQTGLQPTPAEDDATVWQGFIPFEVLPRIYNPARNYIVTANQAVVPLEYYEQAAAAVGTPGNYVFSEDWSYGQRGNRINELMVRFQPLTVEDYAVIHGDTYNADAPPFVSALRTLPLQGEAADLVGYLGEWDFFNDADDGRAALFGIFTRELLRAVYLDQLPDNITPGGRQMYVLAQLLDDPENPWWDDVTTVDAIEDRDAMLLRAWEATVAAAPELLGADRAQWRWGTLHTATFVSNPLGISGIGLIEDLVNRGPAPTGGGTEIVNATGWDPVFGFGVGSLPSLRVIVDVGAWDNTQAMHTTGQSGHPFSEDYSSLIEPWAAVEYRPLPYSRGAVEEASVERLLLRPQ